MEKLFLLVDDDMDDAEFFSEAVDKLATKVRYQHARSAGDLFQLLKSKQQPVIIFLDINMPAVSGWECLTQLKTADDYRGIPVIMYTTSESMQDKQKATQLGANGFITKPDRFKALVGILENIAKGSIFNTPE